MYWDALLWANCAHTETALCVELLLGLLLGCGYIRDLSTGGFIAHLAVELVVFFLSCRCVPKQAIGFLRMKASEEAWMTLFDGL